MENYLHQMNARTYNWYKDYRFQFAFFNMQSEMKKSYISIGEME